MTVTKDELLMLMESVLGLLYGLNVVTSCTVVWVTRYSFSSI